MKKKYDYLIVGSGLFGSVFCHEMTKQGANCLVVEKREHIGGNIYTEEINKKGEYLRKKAEEVFKDKDYIGEIRQIGLMGALEIVKNRKTK